MPPWWGKSSPKDEKKKTNKESFIDTFHRKVKLAFEDKSSSRSRGSRRRRSDIVSERGAISRVPSRSPSPSTCVSRCQSFAERSHALPLPLPTAAPPIKSPNGSNVRASKRHGLDGESEPPLLFPLPQPIGATSRVDNSGIKADLITASISSGSSEGGNSNEFLLGPLAPDYENLNRTALTAPSSHKNSGELLKPDTFNSQNQIPSRFTKRRGSHVQNLQIPHRDVLCSAPDSLLSSPSRSPMRSFVPEHVSNHGLLIGKPYSDFGLLGSGKCSSPGSGHNSGNNSVGGEMSGQLFWPQSRCSPECSPLPSPRMRSPGPSSRIQSGACTPLHPRAVGSTTGSPTRQLENNRQESHWLPHPPITISNTSQRSPTYSAATSPSVPRSPARTETPVSPGSRWKKGRLLGRGSFGHVYLGFNSDSGEFCAMKEVTLSPDDPKSKESAQQLGQEISLLSRLQHPNIVQYYGSETVDDKLYIYLEYVSGGSIYKLLQEYGQFGENAIRNYTQQILSGLAYLHAKNTVHRDIKGANILVHPSGQVKLADFGMAKHITTQSGPLSFKGSPYWMAPEVIKNTNGSNLACDIWSLGCTVLEMATTKPPWSQYGGVPAMFKIGNSKELPEIPGYLSDEGKDFVIQCLKRNPNHRPTAAELLDHPFIRNAVPLERPLLVAEPSNTTPGVANSARTQVTGNARNVTCFESDELTSYHSLGLKTYSGFSASHTPRNMSCPISPVGSPILHSGSQLRGRRSPSPISSPHAVSGSSTPLTHQMIQTPNNLHEGARLISRHPQSSIYTNNTSSYRAPNSSRAAQLFWDNGSDGGWMKDGGQLLLADHVSQQLLGEHLTSKHSLDLKTVSSTQSLKR